MRLPFLLLIATSLLSVASTEANIVTNGDFETAPFGSANTVTGWTVTGTANVTAAAEGATSPTHSAAFAPKGGILSQVVTTTVGQTYNVDFDAGIFGTKTGTVQMRVQAIGSSTLLDQTVSPPSADTTIPA